MDASEDLQNQAIAQQRLLDEGRDCSFHGSDRIWVQLVLSDEPESDVKVVSAACRLIQTFAPECTVEIGATSVILKKADLNKVRQALREKEVYYQI